MAEKYKGKGDAILNVENVKKYFPITRGVFRRTVGWVKAVDDVSFQVRRGEMLGLVGESGCGKTTLGLTILQLHRATAGQITFQGSDLNGKSQKDLRDVRKKMQIIFQDPFSSLNPRMTVGDIVAEPLIVHSLYDRNGRNKRVTELLDRVGLPSDALERFPHEFSGGQRQRIGIARALALNPTFIVADEPVTSLDVSIQAQVVNLLEDLQQELGLTYLFITHDLSMVRHVCHRVVVMYLGKIVEMAQVEDLYTAPLHPYSEALLSAIPIPEPDIEARRDQIVLTGDVPNPANPPAGCNFHPRCPLADEQCRTLEPELAEIKPNHFVACFHSRDMPISTVAN